MIKKFNITFVNDILAILSLLVLLVLFFFPSSSYFVLSIAGLFLAVGISSAVHSAEIIANRVGPSIGTLILALSVTVIEVALIVSLMGNDSPDSSNIARDTVFAAIMIVTNGILGVCILLGGLKHKELGYQSVGTNSLLGILVVLATLTLVLPNFTTSSAGPTYDAGQLIFVSVASLFLYGSLVWAQTQSHKNYFESHTESQIDQLEKENKVPTRLRALVSFVILFISLIAVVGLAKILSPSIEMAISYIGAPKAVVGIVVALLVLAPETLAAINAAKTNQLQTSLNLALGSGAASIALTIPVVSVYSLVSNQSLNLGLDGKSSILLFLTFVTAAFTFASGRTTALSGVMHLVILASYIAMTFMP